MRKDVHTHHDNSSSLSVCSWWDGRPDRGQILWARAVNFSDARTGSRGHPNETFRTDSDDTLFFEFSENFG
jgi:hypothetical protein